jgi:hypothetical protein
VVTPRPRRAGPTARMRTGFDSRPVIKKLDDRHLVTNACGGGDRGREGRGVG